jgi:hypothetical protein
MPAFAGMSGVLRADREAVELDEPCRLVGAAFERVEAFERRHLAADQPEHEAPSFHKAQRREVSGALGVVFWRGPHSVSGSRHDVHAAAQRRDARHRAHISA